MSIYTERLKEIASFSGKIDRATVKEADFVVLQQLSAKICEDYNHGYYTMRQRSVLRSAVDILYDCRKAIKKL